MVHVRKYKDWGFSKDKKKRRGKYLSNKFRLYSKQCLLNVFDVNIKKTIIT